MRKISALLTMFLCFLAFSTSASALTVGGVTWDPNDVLDFSSFSIAIHQDINGLTGDVSGYGFISTMNGTDQNAFIPGGELTFTFGGFTPTESGVLPQVGGAAIAYTGGWVNLYVDDSPEITNPSNPTTLTFANTSDGDLWLALVGHPDSTTADGITLIGTVLGSSALSGVGQLDVIGGLAMLYFDTNQMEDGADFNFTNSFSQFNPTGNLLNANGTGNYFGDSVVPEPATLMLFGIGLLGLAGITRKKVIS